MAPRIYGIIVSVILISALSIGIGVFFEGTAASFTAESENLQQFTTSLNEIIFIDDIMKEAQASFLSFDPLNPLTWGNFVSVMINVFRILFAIPAQIQQLLVFVTEEIFLIPGWSVLIAELLLISVFIFGAIRTINKSEI